jgi:hypothetical protein
VHLRKSLRPPTELTGSGIETDKVVRRILLLVAIVLAMRAGVALGVTLVYLTMPTQTEKSRW